MAVQVNTLTSRKTSSLFVLRMKFTLFGIILASWLLIKVESFNNFPRQVVIGDELSYQPFIPGFRGYSSKDGFYQIIRSYPENSEYSGSPEYHKQIEYLDHYKKKGTCSGIENAVKETNEFCRRVMKGLKELKEALRGCDKVETPMGTFCTKDKKCYALSAIYSAPAAPLTLYDFYQRACPCPQKHFSFGGFDETSATDQTDFLDCFGQISTTTNVIVLSVAPNSNTCTYMGYDNSASPVLMPSATCEPSPEMKFIFACEVPCSSDAAPEL